MGDVNVRKQEYIDAINRLNRPTFEKIRNIACESIKYENHNKLWNKLQHGKIYLKEHDLMCEYIRSYGKMHKAKIYETMNKFPTSEIVNGVIQIVDYGCGQGLGTICFLDYLKEIGVNVNINRIILIDGSNEILQRAVLHISKYVDKNTEIKVVCKDLNMIDSFDLKTNELININIFSNVLDISSIDIDKLSNVVKNSNTLRNYYICVSPNNENNICKFYNNIVQNEINYKIISTGNRFVVQNCDKHIVYRVFYVQGMLPYKDVDFTICPSINNQEYLNSLDDIIENELNNTNLDIYSSQSHDYDVLTQTDDECGHQENSDTKKYDKAEIDCTNDIQINETEQKTTNIGIYLIIFGIGWVVYVLSQLSK